MIVPAVATSVGLADICELSIRVPALVKLDTEKMEVGEVEDGFVKPPI